MIVVCGIPSEQPVELVTAALDVAGLRYVMLNQRRFADIHLDVEVGNGGVTGLLVVDGVAIDIESVTGVYTRMMDWRVLPELRDASSEDGQRCARWHEVVSSWFEVAPGCVMNRTSASSSNASKPHQSQIIRSFGFAVPPTLVTNQPELVREFLSSHGDVVFKSASGMRSIVRRLDDDMLERLHLIRWCPVQFQRYIEGVNVRVHVVAGETFATRIDTDGVDYRYAARDGGYASLAAATVPDDVASRCVAVATALGLELAGVDLIFASDGEVYCLEVNPGPAFSYYELNGGQRISQAIAVALSRG